MADVVVAGPRRGAGQHRQHRLRCGRAPGSGSSRPRTAPPPARADPGTARRRRGPCRRTAGPWTASTNPVCADASPNARQTRDTIDCVNPSCCGHRPRRPVRGIGGRRLQRGGDQRLDPLVADHPRPARPRLIDQPVQAELGEPVTPPPHRARCDSPAARQSRYWTHHRRPPTQFATASPTPPHSSAAAPTPPTRHVHQRSTRSRRHAE